MTHAPHRNPLNQPAHWWHRAHMSTQKLALMMVGFAFLTGFGYVMLTNSTAASGFAISGLQQRLDDLKTQNEKLELKTAELRRLSSVQAASQSVAYQPADSFQELPPSTGTVAVR